MSTAAATRPLSRGRRIVLVVGGLFAVIVIGMGTWSLINLVGQTNTERTVTVRPVNGHVSVEVDGNIEVEVGDVTDVRVVERLRYALGRPRVTEQAGSDDLAIRGRCAWYASSCSVGVTLTVPPTVALRLHSSGGNITVTGVGGALTAASSGGNVRGTQLRTTRVEARSSGGNVDLGFLVPPEAVTAHSSGGNVDIRVPRVDGGYRVKADTSGGRSEIGVPTDPESSRRIDATSSGGNVHVLPEASP